MANRFPLILNTSSNQIQELASGDTLDLTGSGLNLTGITTLSSSAELNLQGGTNLNTGTRGDILFYNASGTIQKLSLGAAGKVLKSNGSDLVYGDTGSIANVYYVTPSGTDASGFGSAIVESFADQDLQVSTLRIGIPDQLVDHASPQQSKESLGLTPGLMTQSIMKRFGWDNSDSLFVTNSSSNSI